MEKSKLLKVPSPSSAWAVFLRDDRNHRLGGSSHLADFSGRNAGSLKRLSQVDGLLRSDGDEKSPGGLRIKQQGLYLVGNSACISHHAFCKVAVRFETSGDV